MREEEEADRRKGWRKEGQGGEGKGGKEAVMVELREN